MSYEIACAGKRVSWEVTAAGHPSRGERVGAERWPCVPVSLQTGFRPRGGGAAVTPEVALQSEGVARTQGQGRQAQNKAVSRNDAAFPKRLTSRGARAGDGAGCAR